MLAFRFFAATVDESLVLTVNLESAISARNIRRRRRRTVLTATSNHVTRLEYLGP